MKLFAQARARILLIEAGGVTLYRWQRGTLRLFARYRQQAEDLQKFEQLLHLEARVPFIVVLDCIEEDFRIETAAHVTGKDRSVMLERKLSFAFRNTPYKIARVVGRETEGRKDDRILMTALTKTELVEPWLSRILKEKLPVQSITSAAYMMELLASATGLRHKPHLLIANFEAGSGLRQTYLQKGRVIFSRLTSIKDREDVALPELLIEQTLQTRKYLERIKQLPYDTRLNLHLFSSKGFELELPVLESDKLIDCSAQEVEAVVPAAAFALAETQIGAIAVSLVLALRGGLLKGVYASPSIRRFYLIKQISTALYSASVAAVLSGILLVSPNILDTLSLWEMEARAVTLTRPLNQHYEELRGSFPETPISSSTMELIVTTYDEFQRQTANPVEFLQWLGDAFLQVPGLQIQTFDWQLIGYALSEEEIAMGVVEPENVEDRFRQKLIQGNTTLIVTVSGEVMRADSFRDARQQVLEFIELLEQRPQLKITPRVMPIDVRSDAAVTTTVDDSSVTEQFVLEIELPLVEEIVE